MKRKVSDLNRRGEKVGEISSSAWMVVSNNAEHPDKIFSSKAKAEAYAEGFPGNVAVEPYRMYYIYCNTDGKF